MSNSSVGVISITAKTNMTEDELWHIVRTLAIYFKVYDIYLKIPRWKFRTRKMYRAVLRVLLSDIMKAINEKVIVEVRGGL